jgi:hypothetical protein
MSRTVISNLLGLLGAVIGGAIGYAGFRYAASQGFYAMILPGGLLGLGCGALALHRSQARGIACLIAGLIFGLFSEWRISRLQDDLGAFVSHIPSFDMITMLMIGVGALLAYWSGRDDWGLLDRFIRKPPNVGG